MTLKVARTVGCSARCDVIIGSVTDIHKENLHRYLAQEPVLRALYFAKQQLNGFLVMKSLKRKRAQKMMPQFLALIEQFEQSPASALAQTLRSWLEPIVRMWR